MPRRSHRSPHVTASSRPEAGQATVEYAALLAVAAIVLTVATTLVGGGALVNGVVGGLERALCLVTGGPCEAAVLSPCKLRATSTGARAGLKLVVKVGRSAYVVREELSDGTVDVTLLEGSDVAPTAGLGASAGVALGGSGTRVGGVASATATARVGRRRLWHAANAAAADRLVHRVERHLAASAAQAAVPVVGGVLHRAVHVAGYHGDELPTADVASVATGVDAAADVDLGGVAALHAGGGATISAALDRRTGRRVVTVDLSGDAGAHLSDALSGRGASRSAAGAIAITYARDGTPLELAVTRDGVPPGEVGLALPDGDGGGHVEVTSRLDLVRPGNRAVYDQLAAALRPGGVTRLPAALDAVGQRLRSGARTDVARYATEEQVHGAEAEVAVGARFGGSLDVARTRSRLTGAWTRPAGGAWQARTDCVPGLAA